MIELLTIAEAVAQQIPARGEPTFRTFTNIFPILLVITVPLLIIGAIVVVRRANTISK